MIKNILNKISNKQNELNPEDMYRSRGARIGQNVDIVNSKIDFCFSDLVTIGNNVTITNSTILAHDASTKKFIGYSKVGRVNIGNDVFIGYGSIVLPNTTIGNKVIVGAGTVVAKDVPDNVVIVGNPWRVLCTFDDYIEKNRKNLQDHPVSNVLWNEKTNEEKREMFEKLENTMGYDL